MVKSRQQIRQEKREVKKLKNYIKTGFEGVRRVPYVTKEHRDMLRQIEKENPLILYNDPDFAQIALTMKVATMRGKKKTRIKNVNNN